MVEFWEQTIQLLQPEGHPDPLVKKPKLKPEYLQKPQFKFLVDVVNAVQKKKRFAAGLFTEEQADKNSALYDKSKMDEAAVKDNKEFYLTAIVNVVGLALEENVPCNIRGVLKGKDAEGANRFLQCLAKAADVLDMDGAEAVARFRNGERMPGGAEPVRPESRRTSKPVAAPPSSSAAPATVAAHDAHFDAAPAPGPSAAQVPPAALVSGAPEDDAASRSKRKSSRSKDRRESDPAQQAQAPDVSALPPQEQRSDGANSLPRGEGSDKRERSRRDKSERRSKKDEPGESGADAAPRPGKDALAPPAASANAARTASQEHVPAAPTMPAPGRPMSAKKAPPKAASAVETSRRGTEPRQGRARGAAGDELESGQAGMAAGVRVFHEHGQEGEDEEVHIVQEAAPPRRAAAGVKDGQHGALVNDMLLAQQRAEQLLQQEGEDAVLMKDGIRIERKKKKEAVVNTDLMQLRDTIEALCQGINPLARSMEYLQEDKDSMQKELQAWRTEAATWQNRLDEEMRLQEDTAAEMAQLKALDDQIAKKVASIKMLKCSVLENEKQLMELINVVTGE